MRLMKIVRSLTGDELIVTARLSAIEIAATQNAYEGNSTAAVREVFDRTLDEHLDAALDDFDAFALPQILSGRRSRFDQSRRLVTGTSKKR